ncbi:MAG: NUDIX hydrolase [Candidatus Thermoplasmatota archaeon]
MHPRIAVDGIVVRERSILMIKRGRPPFQGWYALPGGFVEYGERVEDAVRREVQEETGIETRILRLFGVYSAPDRDPRGHVVSLVFVLEPLSNAPAAGDDALSAGWISIDSLPKEIAFDHGDILRAFRTFLLSGNS